MVAHSSHIKPKPRSPQLSANQYSSIVATGPLLDKVFSLRYKSYRNDNYIKENGAEKLIDAYDGKPHCTSYLTYAGPNLLGSIRCCIHNPGATHTVPAMEGFGKVIEKHVGLDTTFLEVNKFVVNPDFQNLGGIGAKFAIYNNVIGAVDHSESSCVIVAVRPEHVRFYKLMFYKQISGETAYPGLSFKTVLMVCRDLEPAREVIRRLCQRRKERL